MTSPAGLTTRQFDESPWTTITHGADRLPPGDLFVGLLTVEFDDGTRQVYFGSRCRGRWFDADHEEITANPRVTAWRPLPPPAA